MNQVSRPVSDILKSRGEDEGDVEPKIKSREEWRKAKELEEARKSGTAPAAVDEEGRDINPHIPQYIASAPWYIDAKGPTLKHQRPQEERNKQYATINEFYERGQRGPTATRYRKGACENCGAMTHKRKDCMERPRKIGAKFNNVSIAPDEKMLPNLNLDYDGKRDRWAGFEPSMYARVVDEYEKVEEAKRVLKEQRMKEDALKSADGEPEEGTAGPAPAGSDSDDDADEKYADHVDMPGTKVDSKQRITVRNLRIREDTAKYLRNLDLDSAHYDPKTRAMRENPYAKSNKVAPDTYAGENFVRYTGDTLDVLEVQKFSWQASERGIDVHLQAEPTKAEILHKEFREKSGEIKESVKDKILAKYGGAEYLEAPPPELIFAQTENYVEYSRSGKIVKGAEKAPVKSIYEEDVYINNHSAVWGSYWTEGQWGYRCCHSLIKNSYCTGAAGKEANSESQADRLKQMAVEAEKEKSPEPVASTSKDPEVFQWKHKREDKPPEPEEERDHRTKTERTKKRKKKEKKRKHKKRSKRASSSSSDSESDRSDSDSDREERERQKRLKEAMERERGRKFEETDERRRGYNSMYEVKAPTEEEVEAYHLSRTRDDDPMASFINK